MPVHNVTCMKCGDVTEIEGGMDPICPECLKANKLGFKNKFTFENALVNDLMNKYVF